MPANKHKLNLLVASFAAVTLLAVAPVYAESGSGEGTSGTSDTSNSGNSTEGSSSSGTSKTRPTSARTKPEAEKPTTGSTDTLRDRAKELIQTKRADVKEHTAEQKKKACEARAASLNKRFDTYSKQATRHLEVFNSIYTKVQAFQTKKQLDVSNYDALVAATDAKKAAATDAVAALKAVSVTVDCTAADPASSVATVKTAVKNTHTALQDYRKAIKDLVVALQTAKNATSTSDDKTNSTTENQ